MNKLSFIILLFMLISSASRVIAYDTVSTAGVKFTDAKSAAPLANKTVRKKGDRSAIHNEVGGNQAKILKQYPYGQSLLPGYWADL